ncbi:MAG TPA: hypothetical protein VGM01_05090 [Ktedonobacteraceae bacterium]|jgi:uncharacterized membrane protein (DUF2068 family)
MINVQRSRPLGITIIAIIVAIYGILGIIGGIFLLGASATAGIITLILGVLELVLAWGLWTLQSWAFWATVIIEVLALINSIFAFMQGNVTNGIVGIIIALVILIYLFADANVRAAFRT